MIKTKYLCEYPGYIPQLAKLWYDCIGKKHRPDAALSEIETQFRDHLNKDALPLAYIAFDVGDVIGMCTLRSYDGLKSKYLPWLGSLCVDESYRKRGIGKLLVQMAKEKSRKMGFSKLYLFTFEQEIADWYKRNGWTKTEDATYQDKPVIVMEISV